MGVWNSNLGEWVLAEDSSTLTFEEACKKAEAFERARAERQSVGLTVSADAELHLVSSSLSKPNQAQQSVNFDRDVVRGRNKDRIE